MLIRSYLLDEKCNIIKEHDFTTFIVDTLAVGLVVLRHLLRHLNLCLFRLFPRKWHKIPASESVHLSQTETPARFLSGIEKISCPDMAEFSLHSMLY